MTSILLISLLMIATTQARGLAQPRGTSIVLDPVNNPANGIIMSPEHMILKIDASDQSFSVEDHEPMQGNLVSMQRPTDQQMH